MKLESLPNEIFLECFEYLTTWDIFNAFDQLNSRFQTLIQSHSLHLNFQNISKTKFLRIWSILGLNPQMKQFVHSLELFDSNLYKQTDLFLSWFSFDEFTQLKAFSFVDIKQSNTIRMKSATPLTSLMKWQHQTKNLLTKHWIESLHQSSTISHLTLSECCFDDLYSILKGTIRLKYLNLGHIFKSNRQDQSNVLTIEKNLLLKRLIIKNFYCTFEDFELLIFQIPNLQYLTMITRDNNQIINAQHWEDLIRSSLHQLRTFAFLFSIQSRMFIVDMFQQFQTSFWHEEHQWLTDYGYNGSYSIIHTIPYILDEYILDARPIRYQLNKSNEFINVKKLDLFREAITLTRWKYYFPNVTSLTLRYLSINENSSSITDLSKYLPLFVNLSNLQSLNMIANSNTNMTMILLEILKQTRRLSSLKMNFLDINQFYQNDQLSEYLNKMIKKLDNEYNHSLDTIEKVELFCKIFSNIEQLKFKLSNREHILYLLRELSYLSILEIELSDCEHSETFLHWFHEQKCQFNMTFHIEEISSHKNFAIWIERNTK